MSDSAPSTVQSARTGFVQGLGFIVAVVLVGTAVNAMDAATEYIRGRRAGKRVQAPLPDPEGDAEQPEADEEARARQNGRARVVEAEDIEEEVLA